MEQFDRVARWVVEEDLRPAGPGHDVVAEPDPGRAKSVDLCREVLDDPDVSGTITRAYDGLDRLTQENTPQGSLSYTYDAAGRRTSMTVAGQPTVNYAYDAADQLTTISQGTTIVSMASDDAGRRTSLTLPNGITTAYSYNAASQLSGLTYALGATTLGTLTYTYDGVGNRTLVSGTWARTGLPQSVASATYDAANRQLTFGSMTLTYDLNGNLTGDGANTYTWDARNRLSSITGSTPATFIYDTLGRRSRKTINGTITDLVYDISNPVQEVSGAATTSLLTSLGVDEYLVRTDATGSQLFLTDALRSTVALTDSSGAVQSSYTYEPFGAATVAGSSTSNPFQYTGRENDGTGLYYYRARYYDPRLHRFISSDPIGLAAGDTNLYSYVRNRPLKFVDPLGLQQLELVDPVIGPGSGCIPECTRVDDALNEQSRLAREYIDDVAPVFIDAGLGWFMSRIKALEKGMPPGCCFPPPGAGAASAGEAVPSPPVPRPLSPPEPKPPRSKSSG